jgi:seryl-tRNA synthetase
MTANTTTLRRPEGFAPDSPFARLATGDWLLPTGAPGLTAFTPKFETVMARLQAGLTALDPLGSAGPSWYAPVVPRANIERAEYAESFPHLLGVVHALEADTAKEDGIEDEDRIPTDVVLAPAVCYSVYARLADSVLDEARYFDAAGYCYRHEATSELGRFRSFRMREFVVVADEDTALDWRNAWLARCEALFARIGLTVSVESASDPFFGPGGRFMRASQLQQDLKYELIVPLSDQDPGTAIASANSHKDHLGQRFGIGFADGGPAHSSCMAFGLERIALALIHAHGDDLADWPELG